MSLPSPASSSGGDADEIALVEQVARGDRQALRQLYARHAPRAMALAMRVLQASGEAEEVVQESFLEVWRRAPEYDAARGAPQAWIFTICRTRAIDRLRMRAASARVLTHIEGERRQAPSPSEVAEQRELRERIDAGLSRLPPEQRKVLDLAYFEGLSQSEIAQRTGEALGTVKTRVRLGMEKLAVLLAELRRNSGGQS